MAAATATAMYLLLKLTMVTESRYFLFARNLTRAYSGRGPHSRADRRAAMSISSAERRRPPSGRIAGDDRNRRNSRWTSSPGGPATTCRSCPTRPAPCITRWSRRFWPCGRRRRPTASTWWRSRVSGISTASSPSGTASSAASGPCRTAPASRSTPLTLAPAERVDRHPVVVGAAGREPAPLGHGLRRPGCARACRPGTSCRWCPAEYLAGGPFHRLTTWLDAHMHAFGFFRPYTTDRGGVAPEPWHLSYAPVASRAQAALVGRGLARGARRQRRSKGRTEVLAALERELSRATWSTWMRRRRRRCCRRGSPDD